MLRKFILMLLCVNTAYQSQLSVTGIQNSLRNWSIFTERLGIKLKMSTIFHPETDGQTERETLTV